MKILGGLSQTIMLCISGLKWVRDSGLWFLRFHVIFSSIKWKTYLLFFSANLLWHLFGCPEGRRWKSNINFGFYFCLLVLLFGFPKVKKKKFKWTESNGCIRFSWLELSRPLISGVLCYVKPKIHNLNFNLIF